MVVKNSTLLNILLPNENKTLKEVLKEADSKSLNHSKSTNIQDVLKNLFNNLKTETKSNQNIQELLKNSTLFKNLGNFSNNLQSLVQNLPTDEKLAPLKDSLQSFLVNIKDLDENKLKDLVQKSGIFLESKLSTGTNNTNITKLNELLSQVKELIKNDTSPKAKELNGLIEKILTQNSPNKTSGSLQNDLKQTIQLLKEIISSSQTLSNNKIIQLTNQLETLQPSTKLVESKIQNNILPQEQKSSFSNEIKPLLNNLKATLINSKNPAFEPIIKQIDQLIQQKDIFSKNNTMVEPKVLMQQLSDSSKLNQVAQQSPNINQLLTTLKSQAQTVEKLETNILKGHIEPAKIQEVQNQIKQTLTQLQSSLSTIKNIDMKSVQQLIDKLLGIQNLFSKIEIPQTQQAMQQSTTNPTINNSVQEKGAPFANQENKNVQNISAKTDIPTQNSNKITSQNQTVQTNSSEIKNNISTKSENSTPTLQVNLADKSISKQENINNTLSKQVLQNEPTIETKEFKPLLGNVSDNIKSIITAIKSTLAQLPTLNMQQSKQAETFNQFELTKSVNKLETLLQSKFDNIQNPSMQNSKTPTESLQTDIKAALLQIQEEASSNPKLQDLSKQVDKLLTHIDYYQLQSITSSSNYLYLPFIWDMLEDGSVSMKQLSQDHYFCEIHLTLKEFGKMDLLLGLYEENNLDISIFSNQDFVKDMIQEHMVELRVGLNKAGLIPQNIKILDLKEEQDKQEEPTAVYTNPYNNDDLGFGVDIKV